MRMLPYTGTATARRDARRRIRNVLGTSRDDAPTAMQAITAAQHLDELVRDASGGELSLTITHAKAGRVSWSQARDLARGEN